MYEKIKSDSRHFLWVFLLAVDPQITIYMEECHAAARLRERSGKSNDSAFWLSVSQTQWQSRSPPAAEKRETTLLGNQKIQQPGFQIIKWEEGRKWYQKAARIYSVPVMHAPA